MKKLLIAVMVCCSSTLLRADDLMTKRGTPVLPEAKDWSIGFQADPLLKYVGNLFTKNDNTNTHLESQVPLTLVGLYVKDEHTAYRLRVRIGLESRITNNFVDDDNYTGLPPNAKTTDSWKATNTNLVLGAGLQKSRGKGRLRGIYGVELNVGFSSSTDTYTYGNSFTSDRSDPNSTIDWVNTDTSGNFLSGPVTSRTSQVKNPNQLNFGVNGFIGAEFFFAPKLSLSAEYGWGFIISADGERETFTVSADGSTGKETSSRNAKSSLLSLDVRDAGALTLHLYF